MAAAAMELQDVRFAYRSGQPILDGVSFGIAKGEVTALVGPNGSGKTTLLRAISGSVKLDSGAILIDGCHLGRQGRRALAKKVAVVPQQAEFAFDYTVEEAVSMGRIPHLGALGIESAADRDAVAKALAQSGLEHLRHRSVHRLSGGELQLVLIARALAQASPVMLLDEPTSSLDLGHEQAVLRLLSKLNDEQGLTILLVTHDLNLAARESRRVLLFNRGRLAGDGPPAQVLTADAIRQAYGADVEVLSHPHAPEYPLILPVHRSRAPSSTDTSKRHQSHPGELISSRRGETS